MTNLLIDLNEHQRCAVTSVSPVLQVLAPPGSGKTKTLTSRVAYLITHGGIHPWNIIVCTFTLKAAREMKERIQAFIGTEFESKLILGTFHSICRRYLTRYGHCIGISKSFGIADSSDTLAILKRLVKRHGFGIEPSKARSRISRRKSRIYCTPKRPSAPSVEAQEFEQLFELYENTLNTSNLLDYDDLLLRCVELFKQHPECCANIQAILVDEFQDTNTVQYELINLIAQHDRRTDAGRLTSITIVGDPDQSIYSFRSAETKNLLSMQEKYADTQVVMLQQNYRSAGAILDCAMQVIEQDTSRPAKRMESTHDYGTIPVLRELQTPKQEAFWIVRELRRIINVSADLLQFGDFAILLRSASLSRLIESELGIAGIPYRMVGGHRFFDRKEVKIVLDYMRVIGQPEHTEALLRIINEPSRKIGDVTVKNLIDHADSQSWTLWELIRRIVQKGYAFPEKISKQAHDGLTLFFNIITRGQMKLNSLRTNHDNIAVLVDYITQAIDLTAYLKKESADKETLENRLENVNELRFQAEAVLLEELTEETYDDLATPGEAEVETEPPGQIALSKFLMNVALATDSQAVEGRTTQDVVTISTIHAAKGLEWPVVFIPALYHGSIPHSRAEDTDEERRLLYVGMTRAQALLYLSWPAMKTLDEAHCLSAFVALEGLRKKFRQAGPSLDAYQNLIDLSRILRRTAPSATKVEEARKTCETPYDIALVDDRPQQERWKAESHSHAISSTMRNQDALEVQTAVDYISLRRSISMQNQRPDQYKPYSSINPGHQVPTGFTSAATLNRVPPSAIKRSSSDPSTDLSPRKQSNGKQEKKRKKLEVGQGTLATFFQKPRPQQQDKPQPSVTLTPYTKAVPPKSIVQPSFNLHPPAALPPTYQRTIRSARSTPRPVLVHEDDAETQGQSTKYILLSSSPPAVEPSYDDENNHAHGKEQIRAVLPKSDKAISAATVQAVSTAPAYSHVRRLGTGGRAMKSWSEIQREKKEARSL